jgi:hypothetical protein
MIKVRITLSVPHGQHRVHVRGDNIGELVRVSNGLLHGWSYDVASGPEENWRELAALWRKAGTPVTREALGRLRKDARPAHLSEHPDCPFRDPGEGRIIPPVTSG